ncbi:MAG: hypothetical protein HY873_05065 [Chloroflexi bacterium]|nr:hypothetical protein [Chloroflexota bacterium]
MSWQGTFDDALDAAIDAMRSGDTIDAVLARCPRHAAALRPLLEAAGWADPEEGYMPPGPRLGENYSRVEAALGRAQWDRDEDAPHQRIVNRTPWWQRRVALASLSLPAGVFVFALLGAGGAAAATLAVTTDLPDRMGEKVETIAPSWAHSVIPGGGNGDGDVDDDVAVAPGGGSPTASAAISTATSVAAVASTEPAASATAHGPQAVTLSGMVTNIRGNTFELVAVDETYKVQIDAKTVLNGVLAEGSGASVDGELTGSSQVHATRVDVTAPAPTVDTPPASSPEAPGQGDHTPPGQAEKTKTPPGQAEGDSTPPGPPDKTKTPGPPAAPPGQGGANGNGAGAGNGNGNGGNGNGSGNGQ